MSAWKGKTYGGVLGHKIMIFILKYTGLIPAYIVLRFVSIYFIFFVPKATKSMYYFFHTRLEFGFWKSILMIFKNYFVFAQTLLDKIAIMMGFEHKYIFDIDTGSDIRELIKSNEKGLIIISGHVGNWGVSSHMLNDMTQKINVITYDGEYEEIKNYVEEVTVKKKANMIIVKKDHSHILEISNALANNEVICVLGDRFLEGNKNIECKFLGENAMFPSGMYFLAAKLKIPIAHVYTMKKSYFHYRLYASLIETYTYPKTPVETQACVRTMAEDYVKSLETIIRRYPAQWFNYYDFWKLK
jgi:predicted LPLAT superfamily acyltransferase